MAGKVVLCFGESSIASLIASDVVNASRGVGVIVAVGPSSSVQPCDGMPCFQVDYELGLQMLSYIATSK